MSTSGTYSALILSIVPYAELAPEKREQTHPGAAEEGDRKKTGQSREPAAPPFPRLHLMDQ